VESNNGEYPEWECSPEDIAMPMCRSPQISDAQLQASKLPANDNHLPVGIAVSSSGDSKSTVKAGWRAIFIVCVNALLLL